MFFKNLLADTVNIETDTDISVTGKYGLMIL